MVNTTQSIIATEFIIDGGHGEDSVSEISPSMHNDTQERRIQPKRFDEGVALCNHRSMFTT